jgi:carbamoyltransferase
LAPYGKPIFENIILDNLIDIKNDGSFRLDQKYFNYATGLTMTNDNFHNLFGQKPRNSKNEQLTQFHMDIAASIQKVTEDLMIKIAKSLKEEFGLKNLCLAGGVALNCVANGKILKEKIFDNIWVQPASGDAGGSLGAALALWHIEQKNPRNVNKVDDMNGSYLGPEYSQKEIEVELINNQANFDILNDVDLIEKTATRLSLGKAVGWFQGRMEFGPRALGARSILGDPRSSEMQKNLNLKVKYRESFRPFAPSILREDVSEWFDFDTDSPYMLMVANVKKDKTIDMNEKQKELFGIDKLNIKRSEIPAVTHVDYSARIQTVHKETNERYFNLLKKFKEKTNCPVIVNTSFNVRGEPIVNTPTDAFSCFMGTDLDYLVIGNCFLEKIKQKKELKKDYSSEFELD